MRRRSGTVRPTGRARRCVGASVLAAAAVVGGTGCSFGGAGDVVGMPAGSPSPKPAPAELDARLLDAASLGTAWIEQTRLTFASRDRKSTRLNSSH